MPAFKVIEALDDGCWLGTITRANTEKWYVRMYWPGGAQLEPQNVYKSTKIKFEGSKGKAYQSAKRISYGLSLMRRATLATTLLNLAPLNRWWMHT